METLHFGGFFLVNFHIKKRAINTGSSYELCFLRCPASLRSGSTCLVSGTELVADFLNCDTGVVHKEKLRN